MRGKFQLFILKNKESFISKKNMIQAVVSKYAKLVPTDGASMTQFSVTVFGTYRHKEEQRHDL